MLGLLRIDLHLCRRHLLRLFFHLFLLEPTQHGRVPICIKLSILQSFCQVFLEMKFKG